MDQAAKKFDWDRNGYLSMGELYGALEWLNLPGLTPHDVIFFMKNAGAEKTQLSYNDFIAMLLPDAAEGEDLGRTALFHHIAIGVERVDDAGLLADD